MSKYRLFESTSSPRPSRSTFNLSYDKKLTCDMGQLVPVMCDMAYPGDVWRISNELVVRFQPLVAPILHEINVYTYYFFVPIRLLWSHWEDFITGGVDGTSAPELPRLGTATGFDKLSLQDYLGIPPSVAFPSSNAYSAPVSFPVLAYHRLS